MGADLIGVHTYEYADHLRRSLRRMLGVESREGSAWFDGREVRIETHPLGIDVESFARPRLLQSPPTVRSRITKRRLENGG